MDSESNNAPHLGAASKRLAEHAWVICENRIELLLVELQEERDRVLRAFWLSLAMGLSGLLAGVSLSIAIAVACWNWSPVGAMVIVAAIYTGITFFLYAQLTRLRANWRTLPATLDELRKDRECLSKHLN
jgi:uncharacterized membrane protein YqjE